MDQKEAFRETLALCEDRWPTPMFGAISIEHMRDMLRRIDANTDDTAPDGFSEAKLGRWLGYLQGVAVGLDVMALDECKDINKKWADDSHDSPYPWVEARHVAGTSVVNGGTQLLDKDGACIAYVVALNVDPANATLRGTITQALGTGGDPAKTRRMMQAARNGETEANERAEKAEAALEQHVEAIAFRIEQMSGLFDQATINEAANIIRVEFGVNALEDFING